MNGYRFSADNKMMYDMCCMCGMCLFVLFAVSLMAL